MWKQAFFPLFFVVSNAHGFVLDRAGSLGDVRVSNLPPLAEPPLTIGSFNIQVFGRSKYSKQDVMNIILQILSRYDLVQVLEIRDSAETLFDSLRDDLNRYMHDHGSTEVFQSVVSERMGRTSSKEQYGFLYRPSRVSVTGTYKYPDLHDYFEREPFGVRFSCNSTVIDDFAMIASHIQPRQAADEISNLTKVYESFQRHWRLSNMIIAGDFNADCNFLTAHAWENITLRTQSRYTWLIDDDADSTVATSSCSYDRFVVAGKDMFDAIVQDSARAYRFDDELRLTKEQALTVSDHYPIEMQLRGKPNLASQQSIESDVSFTVKNANPISNVNNIRQLYHTPSCAAANYNIKLYREDTHMDHVIAHVTSVDVRHVITELLDFTEDCPGLLSPQQISVINGYMEAEFLKTVQPNVYGLVKDIKKLVYEIEISCSLIQPYTCKVAVSREISGQ